MQKDPDGCQGWGVGEGGMGYGIFFWGDENVLEQDRGDSWPAL